MSLVDNMPIFMPLSPNPPSDEVKKISEALDVAIALTIQTQLVPVIGSIFLANLQTPNPFLISLSVYLDSVISPVISSALSTQASTGVPAIAAWLTVVPTLTPIPAPPFMSGVDGSLFWQAIIQTIRLAIPIPEIPAASTSGSSIDPDSQTEVLRVET